MGREKVIPEKGLITGKAAWENEEIFLGADKNKVIGNEIEIIAIEFLIIFVFLKGLAVHEAKIEFKI